MPQKALARHCVNDAGTGLMTWPVLKPWLTEAKPIWLDLIPGVFLWLVEYLSVIGVAPSLR